MTGITGKRHNNVRTSSIVMAALLVWHAPAADAEEYKLYYLGGQSNMEGFGYVDELPKDAVKKTSNAMIFTGQMAFDNETHGGVGIWEPLQPGHGTGFKTDGETNQLSNRFGPELFFGQTMADRRPGTRIAIIKYALGGSGLSQGVGYGNWHPDFTDGAGINQYDHLLKTLRNALAHADIDGDGVADALIPSGIIWMQGEADAFDSQDAADAYRTNLERLMNLFRAALRVDDLPVVIGKITDSGMAEDGSVMDHIEIVQAAQAAFVKADTCAAFVSQIDELTYADDPWHYDTDSFIRMGTLFAKAALELEATCQPQL